jgi:FkbM family methyltransferase
MRRAEGDKPLTSIRLKGLAHPIHFRPSSRDTGAIIQNMIREEWGCFKRQLDPKFIVDAGAFIGDVTLFFLRAFPKCRIIALEPNEDNFMVAEMNLRPYADRVHLLKMGLWNKRTRLAVTGHSTGSRVNEGESTNNVLVEGIDVDSLLRMHGFSHLDILKLDIEGAEREVFSENCTDWLRLTKAVLIEYHGDDLKSTIDSLLKKEGFSGYRYRSIHYYFNREFS